MHLDFSEFHPLDHTIWECRNYPGGRRRHLQYRWDFQWSESIAVWWRHATARHLWRTLGYRDRESGEWNYIVRCAGCSARPDEDTQERLIALAAERPWPDFDPKDAS